MKKRTPIVPYILLDTRAPIPFPEANITIYQPSIKEIGMSGLESNFIIGLNALTKNYQFEDKIDLSQMSNFDVLMTVIQEKSETSKKVVRAIEQVLYLIFPSCNIVFTPRSIILQEQTSENEKIIHIIDTNNFDKFSQIIYDTFCLIEFGDNIQDDYNPSGDRARAIIEKFKKKHEYLAELRKERGEDNAMDSIYCRYMDILAVGLQKDKNTLSDYSVYQLIEEFKRFQLKETFDYTFQAKMAGATKIKDAKDWMGAIHFGEKNDE